jgi:hypothetical protein
MSGDIDGDKERYINNDDDSDSDGTENDDDDDDDNGNRVGQQMLANGTEVSPSREEEEKEKDESRDIGDSSGDSQSEEDTSTTNNGGQLACHICGLKFGGSYFRILSHYTLYHYRLGLGRKHFFDLSLKTKTFTKGAAVFAKFRQFFAKVSYFRHKYFAKTKSEFSRKLSRKHENENLRPNPT